MNDYQSQPDAGQYGGGSDKSRGPIVAAVIVAMIALLAGVGYMYFADTGKKNKSDSKKNSEKKKVEKSEAGESDASGKRIADIVIKDSTGKIIAAPKEAGSEKYIVEGVELKIKIEEDRVKIKDAAGNVLIKVKQKDDGIKITGANDETILKGKFRGAGFKVKTDEAELGKIEEEGTGFRITNESGAVIGTVSSQGEALEVSCGGKTFTIEGAKPKAAGFIPFLDKRLDAQLGVLIYFNLF